MIVLLRQLFGMYFCLLVRNKVSFNSNHIPVVNHTENNVLSNIVGPPDNNACGEANTDQRYGDLDVLQHDTSDPNRQRVEEVHDAQSLLNAPILSQLTQEHTDDGGGFMQKKRYIGTR